MSKCHKYHQMKYEGEWYTSPTLNTNKLTQMSPTEIKPLFLNVQNGHKIK